MGVSEAQSLEGFLRYIQILGVEVEVRFDEGDSISGKISYVGTDFVQLELPIPGSNRKAICPFYSIRYLSAGFENPREERTGIQFSRDER